MTEPIRLCTSADAHIGTRNYGRTDPAPTSTRVGLALHGRETSILPATTT
jgi:hypothetical protein